MGLTLPCTRFSTSVNSFAPYNAENSSDVNVSHSVKLIVKATMPAVGPEVPSCSDTEQIVLGTQTDRSRPKITWKQVVGATEAGQGGIRCARASCINSYNKQSLYV